MRLLNRYDYGRVKTLYELTTDDLVREFVDQDCDSNPDPEEITHRRFDRVVHLLSSLIARLPPEEQLKLLGDNFELAQ